MKSDGRAFGTGIGTEEQCLAYLDGSLEVVEACVEQDVKIDIHSDGLQFIVDHLFRLDAYHDDTEVEV